MAEEVRYLKNVQHHSEAYTNFQIFSKCRSHVPFKHRPGGSEVLDIPLVSAITQAIAQILLCYKWKSVLQSTFIIKLYPPLDDKHESLQLKENAQIVDL